MKLRILQKLGIELLDVVAVVSHTLAHFVFNLAFGHTALGDQAAAILLKIQVAKSVPGRSFDSRLAVGSNIITPIGIYELITVIATPVLQRCLVLPVFVNIPFASILSI